MVALVWEVPLVSCAVSLAQLLLSLAVDARLSFVVVAAQFAGSLYVMTPLIPGNLMPIKNVERFAKLPKVNLSATAVIKSADAIVAKIKSQLG